MHEGNLKKVITLHETVSDSPLKFPFDQQGCDNLEKRQEGPSGPVAYRLARRIVVVILATSSDRSNIWCLLRFRIWHRVAFAWPTWAQGIAAAELALCTSVDLESIS